jgi:hypothetical protein
MVTIKKKATLEQAVTKNSDSMLMAYFTLNTHDYNARQYTYYQLPEHYSYDHQSHTWHKRQRQQDAIARMYTVHPKDGERFMLRVLLMHVAGAKSFEDLRTYKGHIYSSFWAAAQARGLLKNDAEWINCLKEANELQHPQHLRYLFAMILCCCNPSDPRRLWNLFADELSADFLYKARRCRLYPDNSPQATIDARHNALSHISNLLQDMESSLDKFSTMPQYTETSIIDHPWTDKDDQERTHHEPTVEEYIQLVTTHMEQLTPEQQTNFDIINAVIDSRAEPQLYFIDGPGGTGKTFLSNTLIEHIRGQQKPVVVVASSGIASIVLHQGHTAHSAFNIPITITNKATCFLTRRSILGQAVINATAIFWDESPMLHKNVFEAVDKTFRHLMDSPNIPFGGKVVVFGGDFRQTLPIVVHGTESDIVNASMKKSAAIWSHVAILKLTKNLRIGNNPQHQQYIDYLLRIGDGIDPTYSNGICHDFVRIPDSIILPTAGNNTDDNYERQLIRATFPNIDSPTLTPDIFSNSAILCPLNVDVNKINELATDMLHARETHTYTSVDYTDVNPDQAVHFQPEFLNTLDISSLPPHRLSLKVGQPIILLRNVSTKRGMCDGTRLQVTKLGKYVIGAKILAGSFTDNIVLIPRIPLTTNDDGSSPIKFTRLQFPIRPAFALTINKAQGQTLATTGLYLPLSVFAHGQLYVALSRCSDPNNLKVLILDKPAALRPTSAPDEQLRTPIGHYTRNIVYKEAL